MKLLNHSLKARIRWLLASCLALLVSSPVTGPQAQKTRDEMQSTMRWEHIYFQQLLKQANLDATALRDVLRRLLPTCRPITRKQRRVLSALLKNKQIG